MCACTEVPSSAYRKGEKGFLIGRQVDPRKCSTTGQQEAPQSVPINFFFFDLLFGGVCSPEADGKKSAGQVDKITAEKIDCALTLSDLLTLHAARTTRARPGTVRFGSLGQERETNPSQIAAGHKRPAQIAPSQGNETSIARIPGQQQQKQGAVRLLSGINKVNMSPSMWTMRWSHQVINEHHRHHLKSCSTISRVNNALKSIIPRTRPGGPCTTISTLPVLSAPPIIS